MLYIIGISFAAEMGIKGFYEETVGRVTAWLRGPERTPEDEFALKVADEYAPSCGRRRGTSSPSARS